MYTYLFRGALDLGVPAAEEKDGELVDVKVDEAVALVGNVAAEVAAHDAVPGGLVPLVKLLLDVHGHVTLQLEAVERRYGHLYRCVGHLVGHVLALYHALGLPLAP